LGVSFSVHSVLVLFMLYMLCWRREIYSFMGYYILGHCDCDCVICMGVCVCVLFVF